MFNRLTNFLNKYEILYEQQYGFRQNFSTFGQNNNEPTWLKPLYTTEKVHANNYKQ